MERLTSIYVDMPGWSPAIKPDDFIVAIGKTKSNSVYHVATVRPVQQKDVRTVRYYMKVFHTDLLTAIRREAGQRLITLKWYPRTKRN